MNVHTEQTILHTENFISHLRGEDEIDKLQRILLNTQQLVTVMKKIQQDHNDKLCNRLEQGP